MFNYMQKTYCFKVTPNSRVNEILDPEPGGMIKVKLSAPPVDGKANEALIALISEEWDIPKTKIKLKSGHSSKIKQIVISD